MKWFRQLHMQIILKNPTSDGIKNRKSKYHFWVSFKIKLIKNAIKNNLKLPKKYKKFLNLC